MIKKVKIPECFRGIYCQRKNQKIVGTQIGMRAALVPLTLGVFPFFAKQYYLFVVAMVLLTFGEALSWILLIFTLAVYSAKTFRNLHLFYHYSCLP